MGKIIPAMRGRDNQGAGYFGAPRGGYRHEGIDIVTNADVPTLLPGDPIAALTAGTVTKLGYPYTWAKIEELRARFGDHVPLLRYVQVTDDSGFDVRYFYVKPCVAESDTIEAGQHLGALQRLPYKGMQPHCHLEVQRGGVEVDPVRYLCGDLV